MTKKAFTFAELIPEPLTFKDEAFGGSGEIYAVRTGEMLSIQEVVALDRVETDLKRALAGENNTSEAIEQIEIMTDRLITLVIPDLPEERRKRIPFAYWMRFLEWWKEQQPEPPQGEAVAERTLRRARSSPSSAGSTAD